MSVQDILNHAALQGDFDSSGISADQNGNILQLLKDIKGSFPTAATKIFGFPSGSPIGFSGAGTFGSRSGPATGSASAYQVDGGNALAFHPGGAYIASALSASPYVAVWNYSDAGFGAKLSAPGTLPTGMGNGVAFHPNGNWLAVAHYTSPYLTVYAFDKVGGSIGAKVDNPLSLPAGNGVSVHFSPDGNYLAIAMTASPYVTVYEFNATTGVIGAKVSNPGTLPPGNGNCVRFSRTGKYIAVGHNTAPWMSVYPWSGSFGTKLTDPGTTPGSAVKSLDWQGDDVLFCGSNTSPYLYAYPISDTAVGTKWSNPGTLPGSNINCVAVSPLGNYVFVGSLAMTSIEGYPISDSAFGTKLSAPGTALPSSQYAGLACRPGRNKSLAAALNNGASSHYAYGFTNVGTFWTMPSGFTPSGMTVVADTANVRLVVLPSGGGEGDWTIPQILKSGYAYPLGLSPAEVFVGPDNDGATGKVKVLVYGN